MKRKAFTIVLVLLAALALSIAVSAQEDASSSAPLNSFADFSVLEDSASVLNRYENGLSMAIHTSDLVPGDVYTVWWVFFNSPEKCKGGVCDADDLFVIDPETNGIVMDEFGQRVMDPAGLENANISIQYATGGLVDAEGNGHFAAAVAAGNVPGIIAGPGLIDPQTAEVHLVIRSHGPVIADALDAQIMTFGGGCEPADAPPCVDVQFAVHLPQ
jgi:hypothetical protein